MGTCADCNAAVNLGDQFCTVCGSSTQMVHHSTASAHSDVAGGAVRECSACKASLSPENEFCTSCGASTSKLVTTERAEVGGTQVELDAARMPTRQPGQKRQLRWIVLGLGATAVLAAAAFVSLLGVSRDGPIARSTDADEVSASDGRETSLSLPAETTTSTTPVTTTSSAPSTTSEPETTTITVTGSEAVVDRLPDDPVDAVGVLLSDSNTFWSERFDENGSEFTTSQVRLLSDRSLTSTPCGMAADIPLYTYCSEDQTLNLNLDRLLGSKSTWQEPEIYVLARGMALHIQHSIGVVAAVEQSVQDDPTNADEYLRRLDLQTHCLAAVWLSSINQRLAQPSGSPLFEAEALESVVRSAAPVALLPIGSLGIAGSDFEVDVGAQQLWGKVGLTTADSEACDPFTNDRPSS